MRAYFTNPLSYEINQEGNSQVMYEKVQSYLDDS